MSITRFEVVTVFSLFWKTFLLSYHHFLILRSKCLTANLAWSTSYSGTSMTLSARIKYNGWTATNSFSGYCGCTPAAPPSTEIATKSFSTNTGNTEVRNSGSYHGAQLDKDSYSQENQVTTTSIWKSNRGKIAMFLWAYSCSRCVKLAKVSLSS